MMLCEGSNIFFFCSTDLKKIFFFKYLFVILVWQCFFLSSFFQPRMIISHLILKINYSHEIRLSHSMLELQTLSSPKYITAH